jgi:hypothetical protein
MKRALFAIASMAVVATAVGVETANAQYSPAPPAYTPSSSLRPFSNLYSASTLYPRRAGLWLRPRTLPGRCDRQSCHRKMVQDRSERLPILLDAIEASSSPPLGCSFGSGRANCHRHVTTFGPAEFAQSLTKADTHGLASDSVLDPNRRQFARLLRVNECVAASQGASSPSNGWHYQPFAAAS